MPSKKTPPVPKFDPKFEESVEFRTCKDKAIILGSWLYRHGMPFRFIACSYKPKDEIHHCILQLKNKQFIDATYPEEDAFPVIKKYHNITPLTDWIINENKAEIAEVISKSKRKKQ